MFCISQSWLLRISVIITILRLLQRNALLAGVTRSFCSFRPSWIQGFRMPYLSVSFVSLSLSLPPSFSSDRASVSLHLQLKIVTGSSRQAFSLKLMILDQERMNAFLGGLMKVLSHFLIVPMCATCSPLTQWLSSGMWIFWLAIRGSPALIWDQPSLPNRRDAMLGTGEPWMSTKPSILLSCPRRDQHLSVYTPITAVSSCIT